MITHTSSDFADTMEHSAARRVFDSRDCLALILDELDEQSLARMMRTRMDIVDLCISELYSHRRVPYGAIKELTRETVGSIMPFRASCIAPCLETR